MLENAPEAIKELVNQGSEGDNENGRNNEEGASESPEEGASESTSSQVIGSHEEKVT